MGGEDERMTDEEYARVQAELIRLGAEIQELDLMGFLNRINTAESVGPVLDPTLYMRAGKKLRRVKRVARAAKHFKDTVREVKGEIRGETVQ